MSRRKNVHHRINSVNSPDGQRHEPIKVSQKKHEAFHMLFGHMNVFEIAEELNQRWIPEEYYLMVNTWKNGEENPNQGKLDFDDPME